MNIQLSSFFRKYIGYLYTIISDYKGSRYLIKSPRHELVVGIRRGASGGRIHMKYRINRLVIVTFIIIAIMLCGIVKLHQFRVSQSENYVNKFSAEFIPSDRQGRWESRLVYDGDTVEGIAKDILSSHPMEEISLDEMKQEIMQVNNVSNLIYAGSYLVVPVWDYK